MDEDQLSRMIAAGRTRQLDWLPGTVDAMTIAPPLAALANTPHGGLVLLGMEESGQITGIPDPADAIDRVLQAALLMTPPLMIPLPRPITLREQTVLLVEIPAGLPHVYAVDGRYLTRTEARNVPLHPHDLRRLMMERGEISFEAEVAPRATLRDLDWQAIRLYSLRCGIAIEADATVKAFLVRRGCLAETTGGLYPTHAGLLLFGRDVAGHLRGADITAVRFAGTMMSDTFNRQDISGTLVQQIRQAETFLRDYLRREIVLMDRMERAELYEYPLEAVRELVVNAVAHRDYSISGDGIRLYLFRDRLEITSPGRLPGPVTITNIVNERFSRNPVIVQVLADLGFIERLGYGVDRVIELMHRQGLQAPEFAETEGGFQVVLRNQAASSAAALPDRSMIHDDHPTEEEPDRLLLLAEMMAVSDPTESMPVAHTVPGLPVPPSPPVVVLNLDPEEVRRLLQPYRELSLNPRQEAALVYLHLPENTRITNSELQRLYPDVHPETIRRDLYDLVARNLLVKLGEKRGSYYILREPAVN